MQGVPGPQRTTYEEQNVMLLHTNLAVVVAPVPTLRQPLHVHRFHDLAHLHALVVHNHTCELRLRLPGSLNLPVAGWGGGQVGT